MLPRGGLPRCRLPLLLLLLAGAAVLPPRLVGQAVPAGYEQGLFELHAGSLPPATLLVLVGPDGQILLPIRQVLEHTGTPSEMDTTGTVLAVTLPGVGAPVRLDARSGRISSRDTVALSSGEVIVAGGEIHLAASRTAELLQAAVGVDWETLAIRLARAGRFPAELRREVEVLRAGQLLRQETEIARSQEHVAYRPVSGGGVLDWSMSGRVGDRSAVPIMRLNAGASALGGMLTVGGNFAADSGRIDIGDPALAYHRVFPNHSWIRQLQIGDHLTRGLRARSMRGISIGNTPYYRRQLFDQVLLSPELPTGWQYEVYQGGRLLGFSDAGADRSVVVPLQYGSTPV